MLPLPEDWGRPLLDEYEKQLQDLLEEKWEGRGGQATRHTGDEDGDVTGRQTDGEGGRQAMRQPSRRPGRWATTQVGR